LKYITSGQVEDIRYVLKAVEKSRVGEKGKGRGTERVELTKVKCTHSRDTSRNPFEH
jgi:hypothetical protein